VAEAVVTAAVHAADATAAVAVVAGTAAETADLAPITRETSASTQVGWYRTQAD
jgi:hypothetical protein